jgi:hypothetical protein
MTARFVVAQAQPGSGSAPVQVIKITKPPAGQTEIYHASFNGTVKIDFTAIANLQLTFYHDSKDQTLHIIFADGSQAIIQPFFDSTGNVLSNLLVEVAPDQDLTGSQFAQQFPITEDQSVLPAAGGNVASGADFHNPTVDPLLVGPFLPLLPPEELPPVQFHELQNALTEINLIPTVSGHVFGVVEEEQLNPQVFFGPTEAGTGNEDTHDADGNDHDTLSDFNVTTQVFSGTLAGLVIGGDLPITFLVNAVADGKPVKDSAGNDVTSIGEVVEYHVVNSTTIQGWTSFGEEDARLIFTLVVNPSGTFTFTLNDQIDHPTHTHDDGQGFGEETLNLDLSSAIHAHDANGDQVDFPQNTFDIGVIDDTPVAHDTVPGSFDGEEFFPAEPLDDEDQANGIAGGPGDDGFGKQASGTLDIHPGADNYGSVSFAASISVTATDGVHTTSPSDTLQAIWVDGSGVGHKEDVTLTWTPDGSGGGTLTGSSDHIANVFTLQVDKFGDYTFTLNAPLAHSFTDDPNVQGTQTEFEDNLQLQFTYTATDLDGDSVDAHLTINVDDDVPTLSLATDEGSGTTIVVHDETPGLQLGDELGFADLPSAIQTVFNGLSNKGNDPDVGDDHGAIGYAVGGNGLAIVNANFGADGAALTDAIHFALTLPEGNGVDSGLKTTEGETIYLYQQTINGMDVIVGRIDADHDLAEDSQPGHFDQFDLHDPDDAVAFAITIDPNTGKVYLAQYLSLQHGSADTGDISEPVSLGSGTLALSVTVTDGDGDAVTQAVDVSGEIQFLDDGPFVCVDVDRHFKVVLDEQPGVQSSEDDDTSSSSVRHLFDSVSHTGSDPDVSPKDHGAINFAVSDHAALDVHAFFGADGPKDDNHNGHPDSDATVYSLTLNGQSGKVDSGLTTTDGKHIFLVQEGDLIVGRVDADGNGSVDGNDTAAFAIAITDDGHVATALWLSLHHDDPNHTDDHDIVQLASGTVSATVTITDGDHDTASASADISGLIQFEDDGPSAKSNDTVVVEDDDLANGIDGGPGDDPAPQNASGTLGHDYGSDGPGSITLLGANLPNGTFSVHSNDGTTLIIQQLQGSNNVDVLKIEITDATTGTYQVTQLHAIDHPTLDGQFGDNTENNLDFTVNYRITDGDGDHADGSIKIDVDDDSPDPRITLASGTLVHDETPGVDGGSNDVAPSTALDALFAGVTNKGNDPDVTDLPGEDAVIGYAQQNASALVNVDPRYGADGPGSVVYGFDLNGSHPGTGLQTTDGRNISLFQVNDHLVVGRYEVGGNNSPDGSGNEPAAFAINIDPTSGLITVVQYVSIKHDDRGDPNESNDDGSGSNDAPPDDSPNPVQQWITDSALKLTVTVTDHDGDSITTSANIGHKIIFLDDGPTVDPVFEVSAGVALDESVGNDASNPGDSTQSHPPGDDTGNPAPTFPLPTTPVSNPHAFGEATIDAAQIAGLFDANAGADGEASHQYTLTLRQANGDPASIGTTLVETNLSITDFAATGNPTPVYGSDTIYLVQVSAFQINGVVFIGGSPDASNTHQQLAFTIVIDPGTGEVTVDQYLAIHNSKPGDGTTPAGSFDESDQLLVFDQDAHTETNGGIFVSYSLTDGDGDPAAATAINKLIINFQDDGIGAADTSPTFGSGSATVALVLDDEAQLLGITTPTAPEDVDNPEAAKVAKGTLPITVGSDGLLSIAVDTSVSAVNSAGGTSDAVSVVYLDPSNGNKATVEAVTFTWTPDGSGGGDLVGTSAHYDSSNPAIVLHVNADGTYVLTLNAPLAHPFTDPDFQNNGPELGYEDNLTLQFTYVATDGDGDTASATLSVTVNDDKPVDFTPQDALLDDAAGSGTFALDVFGHTGADGLGTVVFTGIANGDRATATPQGTGDPITSNGHPIYLYNFGSILIGTTQVIADPSTVHTISDLASGQFVFEITLHPDAANSGTDTYTVQVFAPIDNGAGITFDNFSEIGSPGHTDYLVADLPGTQDLIVQGTTVGDSVNTATSGSSVDIGVNNQWIGSGEGIILDFVTLTNPTTSPPTYSNHNTINEATFTIAQVKGNAGDTSDVFVRAFTADNDSSFAPRNTDSGDTVTTITHVFVNGVDVTGSATAYNPDGLGNGFVLQNLHAGDVVVVETASGFNRLQISDAVGIGSQTYDGHDFSVTALGVGTVSAGSPVELSYQVLMTDGDGDGVTGTIQVGLEPVVPPLTQSGTFTGTVEEEQLGHTASGTLFASTFTGNEDTDTNGALVDNDLDTANTGPNSLITTNIALGQDVVTGGTAPLDFHFASGIEGNQAQFAGGLGGVTSQGMPVYLHVDGGNPHLLIGYADGSGGTAHHYDAGTDRVVFTFEITDSAHGDATFTLYDNIDHSVGGQLGDNVEGTLTLDLNGIVEVSDSSSPQKSLLLDGQVNIIDDVPVAHDDAQTTTEGSAPTMNAILVLDFSLSMGDVVPNTGGKTRLQLMKEAVHDFLTNPDVTFNQVTVYTFGVGASLLGQFSDPAAADAAISALTTLSAGTNYAAATSLVDSPTGDGYANLSHPAADITNLYFLSDGDPTSGTSLTSAQETAWTNFLNDSGNDPDYPPIDKVYAIGFSDISSTTFLDQIAPRAGDVAEIVSDPTALSATLTSTLPPPETTGNVLTDGVHDGFGADGPHTVGGHFDGIVSITVDGHTYSFDGTSITLPTGNPAGATANGATLDVDTTLGGHLTFHFADGTGFSAGDYAYTAPASVSGDQVESFHYVIEDGDGDRTGADLQVTVHDNPNTPPTLALHGGDFVLDQFNAVAYNNNDGSVNWNGSWNEVGDDSSASGGEFLISTSGNSHLQLNKSVGNGDYISRNVDLSGAATAVLTFDYNTQNLGSGGRALHVQAWDGSSWQELGTISGNGTFSQVLTPAETILNGGIRFLVQGNWDPSGNSNDASASIDNVEISYTLTSPIADYTTTYVENGAGVSIVDVTSAISDTDSANMQAAHIVLTNEQAGDFLAINGTHVHNGNTGIVNGIAYTVSDNGSQVTIDLSGSHTKADYQAAINAITFASDSENPSETDRTITATVTDDHGNVSNTATTTVHVDAVNDPPVAHDLTVVSSFGGNLFTVPDAAFLAFCTDADGDALSISGVSNALGFTTLSHSNTTHSVTIDDNNNPGGSFDYTIDDGHGGTDTGSVTYQQDTNGTLSGTNGDDIIVGGPGNQTIDGGSGRDYMIGGGGSDTYVFNDNDSGNTLATADIISDFDPANDMIDLSAVDAGPGSGDQDFSTQGGFHANTSTVFAHGVSWFQNGADTVVQIDTDGNTASPEMMLVLTGVNASNLHAANFVG